MGKRTVALVIVWTLFAVWILVATVLSSQNGPSTTQLSLRLIRVVGQYIPFVHQREALCNDILRKAAHVVIFTLLCSLLYIALVTTLQNSRQAFAFAIGFSAAYALFDEAKKLWIPGRHLHWVDVGMNLAGVLLAVAILILLNSHIKWIYERIL